MRRLGVGGHGYWNWCGALVFGVLCVLASIGGAHAAEDDGDLRLTLRTAHFAEPLVATGPTTKDVDEALARAVSTYAQRKRPDDFSSLTEFLARHPRTGWTTALYANLGLSYLHYGYFSRARDAWQKAWATGKEADVAASKPLVDRALGELLSLEASLGNMAAVESLSKEAVERSVTGAATEKLQTAVDILRLSRTEPKHLFNCGPIALRALMLKSGVSESQAQFLLWYQASASGTNLAELGKLAQKGGFPYRLVFRQPGQPAPIPSVVHWKVGHFAAVLQSAHGRYQVADAVFPNRELWMTPDALDAEASGYFLVPSGQEASNSLRQVRQVSAGEAAGIWGKGPTTSTRPGGAGDQPKVGPTCGGMCRYAITRSAVSVNLGDTPVGYDPAIGPPVKVSLSYNQREDAQPVTFDYFNIGQKWTLSWLSFVTDDPSVPGASVSRSQGDGGAFFYSGYDSGTGRFAPQDDDGSVLTRVSGTPIRYERQRPDGSVEVYTHSDGATAYPRRIFLAQVIDPQGNAVTLGYDGQLRLLTLTDAVGRDTTFSYEKAGFPLLVTKITDPFGRSAKLTYDGLNRLKSITDTIGLTSSFTYDANSLVDSMTTPYGTTGFAFTAPGTSAPPRYVEVTDAMGFHERVEWLEPAPIPNSDDPDTVPVGMPVAPVNDYLDYRNSFYWDKEAYVAAGCTPSGGCDYDKALNIHYHHMPGASIKDTSIESIKKPLENRVWYSYPGQTGGSIFSGSYDGPIAIGRVLDDGTTQITRHTYDTANFFRMTETVDPVGRVTKYTYAPNGIDLLAVTQTTEGGGQTSIDQFTYNNRHRPLIYTDAAGETTRFAYNSVGQLTSITNALQQKTSFVYGTDFNLSSIVNANNATASSYIYDSYARVRTYTDSEGWTVTFDYDDADRITSITYPDGTARKYAYDRLDLVEYEDREARIWRYTYDANRRLTQVENPAGATLAYGYDRMNRLTSLTDANSNVTTWAYDVQGRLTSKEYADTSTVGYVYEDTISRLKTVTDALGQIKEFGYTLDNRVAAKEYSSTVNPTPNVSFLYDPYFPRLASRTDGVGTTHYEYAEPFTPGALSLSGECLVPTGETDCSVEITYSYDELSRLASRTIDGAGPETLEYDVIGRLIGHTSDLGEFALTYLGQTEQITNRDLLTGSTDLETNWSYLNNTGDRRLAQIENIGLSSSDYSTFQFTTTRENYITAVTETSDAATVYPVPAAQSASFNDLNQLTNLSGQTLTYDDNGNLLSDGQRDYEWDAENRLVEITYPGQPGKKTEFTYDGADRRVAIVATPPGGGSSTTKSYVWCGQNLCQARDDSNTVTRAYYAEGELSPGSPANQYFYGVDQIGSVRRVFASTGTEPTYAYDPYGVPLQGTAALSDFGYAAMFDNTNSGLGLTLYRAYDRTTGRWLSRDPIGEASDATANLYSYVGASPVAHVDPLGLYMSSADMAKSSTQRTQDAGGGGGGGGGGNPAAIAAALGLAGLMPESGGSGGGDKVPPGICTPGDPQGDGPDGDKDPSTPTGRSGNPMDVTRGTNQPGAYEGRDYSGHAFDQMQGRGIPPSAVENAIQQGAKAPGNTPGSTTHYDAVNNVTAVTNSSGRVITVRPGPP
jgi:RHS repeat-associated protein